MKCQDCNEEQDKGSLGSVILLIGMVVAPIFAWTDFFPVKSVGQFVGRWFFATMCRVLTMYLAFVIWSAQNPQVQPDATIRNGFTAFEVWSVIPVFLQLVFACCNFDVRKSQYRREVIDGFVYYTAIEQPDLTD